MNHFTAVNTGRQIKLYWRPPWHKKQQQQHVLIDVRWSRTGCSSWPRRSLRGVCVGALPIGSTPPGLPGIQLRVQLWPLTVGRPGPGLQRSEACVVWVGIFLYIYVYKCVCVKCVSKRIVKQACMYLSFYKRVRSHAYWAPARVGPVFGFFSPSTSHSVLSPQADILIITSLVNWKCEPRKQNRAKKVFFFPLIGPPAERLVVCSVCRFGRGGEEGHRVL